MLTLLTAAGDVLTIALVTSEDDYASEAAGLVQLSFAGHDDEPTIAELWLEDLEDSTLAGGGAELSFGGCRHLLPADESARFRQWLRDLIAGAEVALTPRSRLSALASGLSRLDHQR